ncbi:MAG: hypothetical protein NZ611_08955 [Bacteroidia bacterium]|nr:hypothetical protein [Bacteroidia bacterium]
MYWLALASESVSGGRTMAELPAFPVHWGMERVLVRDTEGLG